MNPKHAPSTIKRIRELYFAGYGQTLISRQTGVPEGTVRNYVHTLRPLRNKLPAQGVLLPIPETATLLTPAKARIIGYLMGDGCINSYSRKSGRMHKTGKEYWYPFFYVGFTNINLAVINQFIADCKQVYDVDLTYKSKRAEVRIYRKEICRDLLRYGPYGTFSWRIHDEIIRDPVLRQEWIKAFCDAEATVDMSKRTIVIYSANKSGLLQIQDIFRLYGMHSYINGPYASAYRLKVSRPENLALFARYFGFYHDQKLEKLQRLFKP